MATDTMTEAPATTPTPNVNAGDRVLETAAKAAAFSGDMQGALMMVSAESKPAASLGAAATSETAASTDAAPVTAESPAAATTEAQTLVEPAAVADPSAIDAAAKTTSILGGDPGAMYAMGAEANGSMPAAAAGPVTSETPVVHPTLLKRFLSIFGR